MNDKRPLVLWSGGFDSTALVIDLLHDGDIDVLYVNLDNNKRPQKLECKARAKLKCIIADANLKGKIVKEHTFGYDEIFATKSIFAQPALWLNATAFVADVQYHDSVQIAYVKGDDVWHYKTEVKNAYSALNQLVSDGDEVPLKFPYEWCTKQGVLDILTNFVYHEQVMKAIRYCEADTRKPCGDCASCKRHANEIEYTPKRLMKIAVDPDEYTKEKADA